MFLWQHYIIKKEVMTTEVKAEELKSKLSNRLYTDSLYYDVKLTEKFSKMLGLQLFSKLNSPVSPEEFLVLDVTYSNPDICQRDLAKLLVKDRANTGRLLESLEKKAFIKRVVDVKNNRLVKRIVLTEEGDKILHDVMDKVLPVFDKVSSNFTEEEIRFTKDMLKRMRDTFKDIVELQI